MVNPQVVKQSIKWIVYSFLLVNFILYLTRDWNTATHTMSLAERIDFTEGLCSRILCAILNAVGYETPSCRCSSRAGTPCLVVVNR